MTAVDAYSLLHPDQVRRGVERGLVSGGANDRLDHRRGRAFAVRSRDNHRLESLMRVSEFFEELSLVFEIELGGQNLVAKTVEVGQSFRIIHSPFMKSSALVITSVMLWRFTTLSSIPCSIRNSAR